VTGVDGLHRRALLLAAQVENLVDALALDETAHALDAERRGVEPAEEDPIWATSRVLLWAAARIMDATDCHPSAELYTTTLDELSSLS
jgi:hypothetical protein